MIKAIILDFDGVIAESNNVKTEAFAALFNNYPKAIREKIKKFHLQNGGMSRFDKFKYIYKNFFKQHLSEKKLNSLCSAFNRLVLDKVINAQLVEGIEDFLKRNRHRYDMYIVSGTPEYEIKEIVKRRGLKRYFLGVYGSPATKKGLIDYIINKNNYYKKEVIFLGDSINDYEGARAAGIKFVAKIYNNSEVDIFPGVNLKMQIKTIDEFEEYLNRK